MHSRRIALLLLIAGLTACPAFALFDDFNHPELNWFSFETEHFIIYYTEGLDDVAALGAKVAEEIHEPLCELYDYRPDTKVSLIFSDNDDIANAASYFQSNKIHFYATSMAWDFRGTHNWLRNVVTHEYAHMIQLGAARKWARRVPAIYGQFLGYERERRPDVLYGYPNRLVSWPLPSVTIPAWFAEGTAQYQFSGSGFDYWDSNRDMLLRQAVLSDRLLSFDDMGYFGKTSLESEGIYNQGFAFTKYIADRAGGAATLEEISRHMSSPLPVTIDQAIRKATGKRGTVWFAEWKADLEGDYGALRNRLAPELTRADTIPVQGYVNLYPRLSPDGSKIAFISNQNRDYFGQSSLYVYSIDSAKSEIVTGAAHGGLSWLPDGTGVLFARRGVRPLNGALQYDIVLYRFTDKKEFRLSRGLRAESVDISPDGKTLAFSINERGRRDIALAEMPDVSGKFVPITPASLLYRHAAQPHEQFYLPRWSPDGRKIAVAQHRDDGRTIQIFDVGDDGDSLVFASHFDAAGAELRDASWLADGSGLVVSWNISGIANIYTLNIESGTRKPLTSLLGGGYYPDLRGERLVYSDFCENGFRICLLDDPAELRPARNSLDTPDEPMAYAARIPKTDFDFSAAAPAATPYKPAFESLYWFPRIAFDYGTFKPGTYILLNDVLEKLTFLGGFAINQKRDYDLFGMVEYRAFYPTFFVEYYNIQRRLTSHFADSSRIIGEEPGFRPIYDTYRIRFRYSLNEIEAGLRVPLAAGTHAKVSVVYDRFNAHNRFDDGTAIGITYFKGWAGKLGYFTDQRRPGVAAQINPRGGYKAYLEMTRANHLFYTDLEIGGDAVGLQEIYAPYNYDLFEGGVEKYFGLPGWDHSLEMRAHMGLIDRTVDPFFYLYAGGLPGMRGYSFYSLGGERVAVSTVTYRYPIVRRADWNLWPLAVNRIYGNVFMDVGNAWNGEFDAADFKKDIGAGLRLQMHSFYSYPTAVALDVAYGFDRFSVTENDRPPTDYGRELRYYLTVLFDFYSPFGGTAPPRGHRDF